MFDVFLVYPPLFATRFFLKPEISELPFPPLTHMKNENLYEFITK